MNEWNGAFNMECDFFSWIDFYSTCENVFHSFMPSWNRDIL